MTSIIERISGTLTGKRTAGSDKPGFNGLNNPDRMLGLIVNAPANRIKTDAIADCVRFRPDRFDMYRIKEADEKLTETGFDADTRQGILAEYSQVRQEWLEGDTRQSYCAQTIASEIVHTNGQFLNQQGANDAMVTLCLKHGVDPKGVAGMVDNKLNSKQFKASSIETTVRWHDPACVVGGLGYQSPRLISGKK